jgi:hypothetical protein
VTGPLPLTPHAHQQRTQVWSVLLFQRLECVAVALLPLLSFWCTIGVDDAAGPIWIDAGTPAHKKGDKGDKGDKGADGES